MRSAKLFGLAAIVSICAYGAFAALSFSRSNFFLQHLENFPAESRALIGVIFGALSIAYLLLYFVTDLRKRLFIFVISLIAAIALITPPLLSRDMGGYLIGAKILFSNGANPYLLPLSFENDWSQQMANTWWLADPFAYGPLMLAVAFLPWLFSFSHFLAGIYLYKLLVLTAALGSFILFRKIRIREQLPGTADWLVALNPALIINILFEGHNDIFIILALLLFCYYQDRDREHDAFKTTSSLVASIFIKYSGFLFLPLAWFKKKKFSWQQALYSSAGFAFLMYAFLYFSGLGWQQFVERLLFFTDGHCYYKCSPLITFFSWLPGGALLKLALFAGAYAYISYRFLYKRYDAAAFIFWAGLCLFSIQTQWLTPWYGCLLIPFALLSRGRVYRLLVLLITAYCLFHYLAWV